MAGIFSSICKKVSKLIHDDSFIKQYKTSKSAFTRNRKIGFSENIAFILNTLSRTLQIELDDFISNVLKKKDLQITKQAFSKSRKNISWQAFQEIFTLSRDMILKSKSIKRVNGYRVFAIDASEVTFDRTHDIGEYFTSRSNASENKNNARISLLTEVVDGFVIDANIGTLQKSERNFAKEHLEILNKYCNSKDIVIFDRGYPSKEMISILSKMQCKYLMRLQASSFKEVSENSGSDFDIKIKYQNTEYPVRVIRITLNTGEIETLITNLTRKQFKIHEFKKLYALRWSVETTYNTIKNKLLIEKFSGRTVLSIHQDFYATMFLMNCVAAISSEVNDEIRKEKSSCKYDYKANRNLIVGYMKHRLSSILLKTNVVIKKLCKKLIQLCCKQPVPVKPDRSFNRPIFSHQRKVSCPKYAI